MAQESNWKFFVVILIPIVLQFIPFLHIVQLKKGEVSSKESLCLYALVLMTCYWVLNAMPQVVTALIPLAIIPLFEIMNGKDLAKSYMREPTMLVFGALILACAFLGSDLHKRIALKIMTFTGNSTGRIVSAVFVSTLCLSMFITGVAASLIMVATALSLIEYREIIEGEKDDPGVQVGLADVGSANAFPEGTSSVDFVDMSDSTNPEFSGIDSYMSTASVDPKEKIVEPNQTTTIEVIEEEDGESDFEVSKAVKKIEAQKEPAVNGPPFQEPEKPVELKLNIGKRDVVDKKLKKQFFITIYVAANIGSLFLPHNTPVANVLYDWGDYRKNKIIMGNTTTSLALTLSKNGRQAQLTTGSWILYVLPTLPIVAVIAWLYLSFIFTHVVPVIPDTTGLFSRRSLEAQKMLSLEKQFYTEKYRGLGKLNFQQIVVILLTVLVFFLWVFRDPRDKLFKGWAMTIPNQGDKDIKVKAGYSAPVIMIITIMFMIPRFGAKSKDKISAILGWKFLEAQVLWNLLLLLGGCFAIAECVHRSGLSMILLRHYSTLAETVPHDTIHLTCIILSLVLSELCSGVTSVCIIIQVFVVISKTYPTLGSVSAPVTVMSILSFMLPVATTSNALVFTAASGDLKILDMIKYGALLDLVSLIVVMSVHFSYGNAIFDKM